MPSQFELIPCSYLRHETFFSEKRKTSKVSQSETHGNIYECVLSVPEEFNK